MKLIRRSRCDGMNCVYGEYLKRFLEETQELRDATRGVAMNAATLADTLREVRNLHRPESGRSSDENGRIFFLCGNCSYEWPCPTIKLLEGVA